MHVFLVPKNGVAIYLLCKHLRLSTSVDSVRHVSRLLFWSGGPFCLPTLVDIDVVSMIKWVRPPNECTKAAILTSWKIVLEILGTVSKPLILCFVEFLTLLNWKARDAMWWTKLELYQHGISELPFPQNWNQQNWNFNTWHLLSHCSCEPAHCYKLFVSCSILQLQRFLKREQFRSLHFCEFRNLTQHKWFTYSAWGF